MKRAAGILVGLVWLIMAGGAFRTASLGSAGGHPDLGLWWSVIGALLAIAGLSAIVGTWIHTGSGGDESAGATPDPAAGAGAS